MAMIPPLDDSQRAALLRMSAFLCALAVLLAPAVGRTSLELRGERARYDARLTKLDVDSPWNAREVAVARDPFKPDAALGAPQPVPNGSAAAPVVGMQVRQGAPIPAFSAVLVNAVVTGSSPRALVDDSGRVRIVGVGDTIDGSRVIAIDARGVRLQNGARFELGDHS